MNTPAYTALQPHSSFDVATSVMTPGHVQAKFAGHDLPLFTEDQKAANQTELAFGIDTGTGKEMALSMLEAGVPIPGIQQASVLLGVPFMFWARDFNAQRDMQNLAEQYAEVIADKTGIAPEQVNEQVVLRYATQNETLAGAIKAIAHKREQHIANTAGGVGGMLSGAAAGAAIGGPIGLVAGLAGGFLGFEAGEGLLRYITNSTDATDPQALVEAMKAKREDNQMVTALDVFTLRVAQHPALQEAIAARHGDHFHSLSSDDQRTVMAGMPNLVQQAMKDAACCNLPDANLHYLMLGEMPMQQPAYAQQPTQWTSRVASERGSVAAGPEPVSWTDAIMQRRAAIADQSVEPTV